MEMGIKQNREREMGKQIKIERNRENATNKENAQKEIGKGRENRSKIEKMQQMQKTE